MTREEALEHFKEQLDVFGGEHAEAIKVAIEALQTPPITQRIMYQEGYKQGQEDRPRGHWIDGKWCSVCGMPIATDVWGTSVDESEVHYCIECGADMRGKQTERSE